MFPRVTTTPSEDAKLKAAMELHRMGTARVLEGLGTRPGHHRARAYLRDVRWDMPEAGDVPLGSLPTGVILAWLRLRRVARLAAGRWWSAVAGCGLAGMLAGLVGSLILRFGPSSIAGNSVLVALPLIGTFVGVLGGVGVGAGMAAAEGTVRSFRRTSIVISGGSDRKIRHAVAVEII